jgi:hypothetical protein
MVDIPRSLPCPLHCLDSGPVAEAVGTAGRITACDDHCGVTAWHATSRTPWPGRPRRSPTGSLLGAGTRRIRLTAERQVYDERAAAVLALARRRDVAAVRPDDALASLIQATLTPIIAPLVAEQAALRQTVERQADAIADLREDRGRLTAELERAAGTVVALSDELERLRAPAPSTEARTEPAPAVPSDAAPGGLASMWMRWGPLLAVLGMVVVIALLLLFVPR